MKLRGFHWATKILLWVTVTATPGSLVVLPSLQPPKVKPAFDRPVDPAKVIVCP